MDRSALVSLMDGFLDGLHTRDPGRARLSANVRYTENGQELAIGDGAWGTVKAPGGYRHDFIDAENGQIASMATIMEGNAHSILVTRLAVADGAIAEVECFAARPDALTGESAFANGPAKLDEAGTADARWFEPIPPEARMSREDLRHVANLYFAGLERNDGKGYYPFADDCIRIEHGVRTTGNGVPAGDMSSPIEGAKDIESPYRLDFKAMTARQQFETGYFAFVDRIRHRRFPIIDQELGVVFALAFFDHSGTVRDYPMSDGRVVTSRIEQPFSWQIGEAFRIEDGLITRIEAVMAACPYGMPPGWALQPGDLP